VARPQGEAPEHPTQPTAHRAVLAVTLLFVLAAISVSTGLVVYTAWLHDLENGFFALLFATLSVRAALSWCLWHHSWSATQRVNYQQDREGRKPADEAMR
jgi:hypothetical protein